MYVRMSYRIDDTTSIARSKRPVDHGDVCSAWSLAATLSAAAAADADAQHATAGMGQDQVCYSKQWPTDWCLKVLLLIFLLPDL